MYRYLNHDEKREYSPLRTGNRERPNQKFQACSYGQKTRLARYQFVDRVGIGQTLFVGEGNLSFSLSIANNAGRAARNIFSTTFENASKLGQETRRNAHSLRILGASVYHDIDGVKLDENFERRIFETIVFQFPNVGSRQPKYGRNPNHHLLTRFLKSARHCLKLSGEIAVTIVNNPHYDGAFDMFDAARKAGYSKPCQFNFNPKLYPGYSHVNTNDGDSAISRFRSFRTWMFRPN